MSLATLVGGLLAYPVNYLLVAHHLKHGCMTLPDADGPAPGLGHHSLKRETGQPMATADLSRTKSLVFIGLSFLALAATLLVTNSIVPIRI